MREVKTLSTHFIHQMLQAVPAEQHEDVLEKVLIGFPEITEMFGDVNATYIISDISARDAGGYTITFWDAAGCDHEVNVDAAFPLIHFFF